MGFSISGFKKMQRKAGKTLPSQTSKPAKSGVQTERRIYLFSQFDSLAAVIAYFFLSLSVGHFCCKSSKNRVQEGCKMILGFMTQLLQEKVLGCRIQKIPMET